MQIDNISSRDLGGGKRQSDLDDAVWQQAILGLLLNEYPGQMSKTELARELLGEDPGFAAGDAYQRALEALINAGLLQSCEPLILPTRAAQQYHQLESN